MWRLVRERVATLAELELQWSLDDAAKANEMLDAFADAEAAARRRSGP